MKWTKFVLLIQAVITLLIGIIFFLQVFSMTDTFESDKKIIGEISPAASMAYNEFMRYDSLRKRFFYVSYILVIFSLIQLIIIWRLFDYRIKKTKSSYFR